MSEKYPRIFHLPFSPGCTTDDKVMSDVESLLGRELILTEKMDGSNVCLESEQVYGRSHTDAPKHESFSALKALHASTRHLIPPGWQVFGEWLWAMHSIFYDRLPSPLLLFGIRHRVEQRWLSWDETVAWAEQVGFSIAPALWCGACATCAELERLVEKHRTSPSYSDEQEGLVVRIRKGFPDAAFQSSVAKWVRADHVQTTSHWREQAITRNRLISSDRR